MFWWIIYVNVSIEVFFGLRWKIIIPFKLKLDPKKRGREKKGNGKYSKPVKLAEEIFSRRKIMQLL